MSRKIRLITAMLLLSICLGISAIFVSASDAEESLNQLTPAAAQNIYYADFENGVKNAVKPDGSELNISYVKGSSEPVQFGYGTYKGDEYISFRHSTTAGQGRFKYALPLNSTDSNLSANNFDYYVLDFDFSTDRYCYNNEAITVEEYNALADDEKAKAYPAYPEGMSMSIRTTKEDLHCATVSIMKDSENKFYLEYTNKSSYFKTPISTTKAYLKNEVGTTDHLTVVVKADITKSDGEGNLCAFYLNGSAFCTLDFQRRAKDRINIYQFLFEMTQAQTAENNYAFCLDNIATNMYATGYSSSEEKNLTNLDFKSVDAKISDCTDVVYNSKYLLPGSPYVMCAGQKVRNPALVSKLLENLEDGGTILTSGIDIENFMPSDGITNFEVVCEGGATFTLSEEAMEFFAPLRTEGTSTRYYPKSTLIELEWQDVNEEKIFTEFVIPGSEVTLIEDLPEGVVDYKTFKYHEVISWNMCFDGVIGDDTTYPESPIGTPTEYDMTIYELLGNGKIIVYPVISKMGTPLAYTVFDSNGDMIFTDEESLSAYVDIANLQDSIDKAPEGAKIVLNGDGKTEIVLENISISAGQTISFDLNGQKIKSETAVFNVAEDAILNVYSSVNGASVNAGEAVVVINDGVEKFSVALGDANKADGIVYEAHSIVVAGEVEIEGDPESVVHINGATIKAEVAFDVNNAGIVFWLKDTAVQTTEALFTDSQYAFIAFKETTVVSDFAKEYNGEPQVFVMPGCVFALTDLDATVADLIYTENDTYLVKNNNSENTVTLGNATAAITFASVSSEKALPAGIAKVEWLYPDGKAFKSAEYWYIGSTLTHPEYDSADIPALALNNGWFDVAYSGWSNSDGGLNVTSASTVFKPIAYLVPNLKGVKMNVSLYGNLSVNVYVPAPAIESGIVFTQDGVHSDMVYDGVTGFSLSASGNIETDNLVAITYNNAEYYGIKTFIASYELDGDVKCYAKFIVKEFDLNTNGTIEENEKNIALTQNLSTSFMTYVNALDREYECGTEEAKVLRDMLQYKRECYKLYNGLDDYDSDALKDYNNLLEGHGGECACKTDINNLKFSKKELKLDYAEISDVIKGYTYLMNADAPKFLMYVPTSFENVEIAVTVNGVRGAAYGAFKQNAELVADKDGNAAVVTVGEVDYYVYSYDFGALCNAAEIMEIEIKVGEFSAKGNYSLAKHIETTPNDVAAKALYAAAKTFYSYKVN